MPPRSPRSPCSCSALFLVGCVRAHPGGVVRPDRGVHAGRLARPARTRISRPCVPATYHDARAGDARLGAELLGRGNLGTLATAGIDEVRFAGGTWTFGAERAAVLAVFTAPGLTADALADFYAESATRREPDQDPRRQTAPTIVGRAGHRLDTKTGERLQTVVVWPSAEPDMVNVVITNDLPDARIEEAIAAFGEALSAPC